MIGVVLRAWIVVVRVRLTLWLRPWPAAERAFAHLAAPASPESRIPSADVADLRRAVLLAARVVPRATCLVQAIALQILLARAGQPSDLRLGVAFDETRLFAAHAWLEQKGRILIGASEARWTPLPSRTLRVP